MWSETAAVTECCSCMGSSMQFIVRRPDGQNIYKCELCELAFVSEMPTVEAISRFYSAFYDPKGTRERNAGVTHYESAFKVAERRRRASAILSWLSDNQAFDCGGTSVEIGCGTGDFCYELGKRVQFVRGIDLSPDMVTVAKDKYPEISFDVGSAKDIGNQSVAQIFAFEVIEHVKEPARFMRDISDRLQRGGRLTLSTPNFGLGESMPQSWSGFRTSFEHLYFFNNRALENIAETSGLSLICATSFGGGKYNPVMYKSIQLLRSLKQALIPSKTDVNTTSAKTGFKFPNGYFGGHTLLMSFQKR